MPKLKRTMFRDYDIRGREADDELNETSMYHIGRGFGTLLKRKGIEKTTVGHDVRATSESFQEHFIKGVLESGIDVIKIGNVTTPMGYWSQHHLQTKGGAVITASHNPVGWNGAKVSDDVSKTLSGEEIQKLADLIEGDDFEKGDGKITQQEIKENYIEDLISKSKITKKFKILVNCGNGTSAIIAPELLRHAGCEVIEHNTNIDPTYPNYTPNPENVLMMEDTLAQTLKHGCDLGMAFDGDGDRLGLVDNEGHILPADIILVLLARLHLKKHPGAKVMFDVKVSEALVEDIKEHGGEPIMYRTGHSFIKAEMNRQKISLTGEMSGHIYFGEGFDYYGFDDAMFAALKVLEFLSEEDQPLSEILATIPHYISTPVINVKTSDEVKHKIIAQITQQFKDEGYKVIDVDGARVYTHDGWGLARASNTNPQIVLRFEAKNEEQIEKIKAIFKEKLDQFKEVSQEWDESSS